MVSRALDKTAMTTYLRLLGYLKPYRSILFIIIGALLAFAVADAIMYKFVAAKLVDQGVVARDREFLQLAPFYIVGIFLFRGCASLISTYCLGYVGRSTIRDLRVEMMDRLLRLPANFYDHHPSGNLIAKFSYDTEQIAEAITNALSESLLGIFMIIAMLWVLFSTSWQISLVLITVGPLLGFYLKQISRRMRRFSLNVQDSIGEVTHVASEIIDNYQVVRNYGANQQESQRFSKVTNSNKHQVMKVILTTAVSIPVTQFIGAIAMSGLIYLATLETLQLTPGEFTAMFTAMLALLRPLKQVAAVNSILQRGITAASSIFGVIDQPAELDNGQIHLQRVKGAICFKDVNFAYPTSTSSVLHQISFMVEPGETVALVGRSGSGKSTIIQLIPRYYDYDQGQILLDGYPLPDIALTDLRRQIAIVSQNVTLFDDSVLNNVAYGELAGATQQQVIDALKAAQAWSFVEQLPQGLNTNIGENGALLSGGQRQRLAIARAILKDAPILILDEATSALDSESEKLIQQALDHLMKDRTTIVVAHRLTTIEKADRIIVLAGGKIVEQGSHKQLLANNHYYTALQSAQETRETHDSVS